MVKKLKRLTSEEAQANQNRRIVMLYNSGFEKENISITVRRNVAYVSSVIEKWQETAAAELFEWETAGPIFVEGY